MYPFPTVENSLDEWLWWMAWATVVVLPPIFSAGYWHTAAALQPTPQVPPWAEKLPFPSGWPTGATTGAKQPFLVEAGAWP